MLLLQVRHMTSQFPLTCPLLLSNLFTEKVVESNHCCEHRSFGHLNPVSLSKPTTWSASMKYLVFLFFLVSSALYEVIIVLIRALIAFKLTLSASVSPT